MTPAEIARILQERFAGKIIEARPDDRHPRVHVNAADWRPVAEFLRQDPEMRFDWLSCLSGVDYPADGRLCVVYDLWSSEKRHMFAVKVFCPRDNPHVPTVCDLWRAAEWHEREAWDLLGIVFDGHPDLRRILCPDDWVGHPLRKDYIFPTEYGGIRCLPEPQSPKHEASSK